ncbi:sulfite exporter TauE/SafE family protein [Hyphomicrobium sp.]|uniref:sulfite exporter TauE/SafE family protein n=1 Tax=Hyphomicrobium sp. TaxID=82 RepID=UPI002E33983E|nr:sulfite exporter TauE/SafE family protein [Hyphomicrobium sp.]HEX2841250.1 sulfite exporter TauE/SafE family protein [Hyphomicrobium sp.]
MDGTPEGHGVIPYQDLLATGSGALVGFVLGLIGGGGSILAVPLLVYVVGVSSPHVAIGTSAVAVAISALANLVGYARAGRVKWRCALVFAAAGTSGAAIGSTFGKRFDGERLLVLFGVLMIAVALLMFRRGGGEGNVDVRLTRRTAPQLMPLLMAYGVSVGALAGFFGIGGGFLVVPGILAATGMPLIFAIGSSLVSVFSFGLTTAGNYALSGLIDWVLVAFFIGGGLVGGVGGQVVAKRLAAKKEALSTVFACIVALVGVYVVWRGMSF